MNRKVSAVIFGVVITLLASACSVTDDQVDSGEAERSILPEATRMAPPALARATTTIPGRVLGGDKSWEEFLARQAGHEREYLAKLDRRYFGALSYATEEERDYMIDAGFPTPEEWMAADSLTDAQLRKMADAGDAKSAGIFADRMSERFRSIRELPRNNSTDTANTDGAVLATLAVSYATQAMKGNQGPFGVYVEGMVKSSIQGTWEPMTAAMFEADRLGDPRVRKLIREMSMRYPKQDIGTVFSSLEGMQSGRR